VNEIGKPFPLAWAGNQPTGPLLSFGMGAAEPASHLPRAHGASASWGPCRRQVTSQLSPSSLSPFVTPVDRGAAAPGWSAYAMQPRAPLRIYVVHASFADRRYK
jgi:hypothetical protein